MALPAAIRMCALGREHAGGVGGGVATRRPHLQHPLGMAATSSSAKAGFWIARTPSTKRWSRRAIRAA